MEIQLSPPIAEQAKKLASAHHTTLDDYVSSLIVQDSAFYEMEKAQMRELLRLRVEADTGLGDDIDTVFDRIKANFPQ